MIVTFSNQKGGVGKSSLCVSLANFWSAQGIGLQVLDVDPQHSLMKFRVQEESSDQQHKPKFEIKEFTLHKNISKAREFIMGLKQEKIHTLIDSSGSGLSELNMNIVLYSDVVIIPFQYEDYSIQATGEYATLLKNLGNSFPDLKRTCIFVPNMVNTKIGRASDRLKWDAWDASIDKVALRSPRVPLRVCLQRRNTLYQTDDELNCVTPCFSYITQIVMNKETNDK